MDICVNISSDSILYICSTIALLMIGVGVYKLDKLNKRD